MSRPHSKALGSGKTPNLFPSKNIPAGGIPPTGIRRLRGRTAAEEQCETAAGKRAAF